MSLLRIFGLATQDDLKRLEARMATTTTVLETRLTQLETTVLAVKEGVGKLSLEIPAYMTNAAVLIAELKAENAQLRKNQQMDPISQSVIERMDALNAQGEAIRLAVTALDELNPDLPTATEEIETPTNT
jgi:phage shock protein A